jgi:hypothetical protein
MEEVEGDEYCADAREMLEYALDRKSVINLAIDKYIKASIKYKISHCYLKEGDVTSIIAQLHLESGHTFLAARNFRDAGEILRDADKLRAKIYLHRSIDLFLEEGKFAAVAKNYDMLAKIGEPFSTDINYLIDCYEKAYDYYVIEGSPNTGLDRLLKAAYLLINSDNTDGYNRAIKHLETAFHQYRSEKLSSLKCTRLLLEIGIIEMFFGNIVGCKDWLIVCSKYGFDNSKEFIFINSLVSAHEKCDIETFTDTVNDYGAFRPFESWQINLFAKIKDNMAKTL